MNLKNGIISIILSGFLVGAVTIAWDNGLHFWIKKNLSKTNENDINIVMNTYYNVNIDMAQCPSLIRDVYKDLGYKNIEIQNRYIFAYAKNTVVGAKCSPLLAVGWPINIQLTVSTIHQGQNFEPLNHILTLLKKRTTKTKATFSENSVVYER